MSQDRLRLIRLSVAASCLTVMLQLSSQLALAQETDKEQNKAPVPAASASPVAAISKVIASGLSEDATDEDPSFEHNDQTQPDDSQSVATLHSDHLIAMKDILRNHLLYGVGFTERIAGTADVSHASLNIWNPYLGFMGRMGRTKFVLQYSPTISQRWIQNGGPKAYHSTSLFLTREFSQKWGASFGLNSSFGEYGLSLTQDSFRPVTGVPVINSPVIQAGLTNIFVNDSELNLHWRATMRRSFSFSTSEAYRNTIHLGHNNLTTNRVHFDEALSRRTTFLAYAEAGESFQLVSCKTFGGGAGMLMHTSRSASFSFSVGPQFASGGCATRKDIRVTSTLILPYHARSGFYLSFDRDFNNLFVSPLVQSRDSIVAGFHKSTVRGISLRADVGYYNIRQCCHQAPFHSIFVSPLLSLPIVRTLTFMANYRFYSDRQINQLSYGRNQFLLTLQWRPKSARESR
jgi:hypothetical protein